ncbi:succinylglutamate desuccinylase/aspartoacylase family protein [Microbacterium sp. LWO12-1.2]|uniref:succinylglutamate desuccinylase/aspartoacylase family protein n=1 Tax=Microbacterium sp. LWO12-1.2 TaxID=3135261 RepID=UPI0034240256
MSSLDDSADIVIPVAGSPGIAMRVSRGRSPGPTLTILGGVHGDEFEGQLAAALIAETLGPQIERGELRVIPRANPIAAASQTRHTPDDDKNLARCFPGSPDGTTTERIARALTESAVEGSDVLIDLHSAGRALKMPLMIGYDAADAHRCAPLAAAFGVPIIWEHDVIGPGRSISTAADRGIAALYVECSGGGTVRREELEALVGGVRRVAVALGMVDGEVVDGAAPRTIRGGDGNLDASITCSGAGIAVLFVDVAQEVAAGATLAEIRGADGQLRESLTAPFASLVMAVRRDAPVVQGDFIAMLAPLHGAGPQ